MVAMVGAFRWGMRVGVGSQTQKAHREVEEQQEAGHWKKLAGLFNFHPRWEQS